MKTFSEFLEMSQLNERFVNLIQDQEGKEKYKRDVWDILQKSYAEIRCKITRQTAEQNLTINRLRA